MTNTTKKIRSILYRLKLSKHLFPIALRSRLVATLILPHVDYCSAAFSDMTAEHNLKFYRVVNACIRFIFDLKADVHITPYYRTLRMLKIDSRCTYFIGCQLYCLLCMGQPSLLYENFNFRGQTSDRATRTTKNTLILPQCRTELFRQSFRLASVRFFSQILE